MNRIIFMLNGLPVSQQHHLKLGPGNLLNKNSADRIPTGTGVNITVPFTVTNIKPDPYIPFVDFITVALNVTNTVGALDTFPFPHVNYPIDSIWGLALNTVKCKEPAFTTTVTVINSKFTVKIDTQVGILEFLLENALLKTKMTKLPHKTIIKRR